MATCENCIHKNVCNTLIKNGLPYDDEFPADKYCLCFKEKSLTIELPCKVGDTIYVIPSKTNYRLNKLGGFECNNRVYEQKVSEICLYKNNSYLVKTCAGLCSALSEAYNKNWFLTYKEAEKALKEREKVE